MSATPTLSLRKAQINFMDLSEEHRICAFVARRQFGKTTVFSHIALKKMMKRKNHTVIFGSAKLNLAREIVRKEAAVIQSAIGALRARVADRKRVEIADSQNGQVPDRLTEDDFADLFEAQRLEFRYYHSSSSYSRTKVVALRDDTVGETGDLMCDEIGRVKSWREVWEAIEPIIASDPTFRCVLSTTPPPDDTHFSFEMLVPPAGTIFPVNPGGNIYRSEMNIPILRVDAYDAWADGVPVYDQDKGVAMPPEEHRRRSFNKEGWDRNYGIKFILGGTAACGILQLQTAQQRGVGECELFLVEDDHDYREALTWLSRRTGQFAAIGLGYDVATTTKEKSNPSVLSIIERDANDFIYRAALVWKTRDPDIAIERVKGVVELLNRRPGGRVKAMCIDATNEKYFAERVRKELRSEVPVRLIVSSESITPEMMPGNDKPTNWKEYLGDQYVGILDDNHLTLPASVYIKTDHRLVLKDRGKFVCEPDEEGRHGDTFDAGKLAVEALIGKSDAIQTVEGTRLGTSSQRVKMFVPHRLT